VQERIRHSFQGGDAGKTAGFSRPFFPALAPRGFFADHSPFGNNGLPTEIR
jgi:hypothetical protein